MFIYWHAYPHREHCCCPVETVYLQSIKMTKLWIMSNMHWHPAETMLFVYEPKTQGCSCSLYNKNKRAPGIQSFYLRQTRLLMSEGMWTFAVYEMHKKRWAGDCRAVLLTFEGLNKVLFFSTSFYFALTTLETSVTWLYYMIVFLMNIIIHSVALYLYRDVFCWFSYNKTLHLVWRWRAEISKLLVPTVGQAPKTLDSTLPIIPLDSVFQSSLWAICLFERHTSGF